MLFTDMTLAEAKSLVTKTRKELTTQLSLSPEKRGDTRFLIKIIEDIEYFTHGLITPYGHPHRYELDLIHRLIRQGWNWIARDPDGTLYAFETEPSQTKVEWISKGECEAIKEFDDQSLFSFLTFQNGEKIHLRSFITGYEYDN